MLRSTGVNGGWSEKGQRKKKSECSSINDLFTRQLVPIQNLKSVANRFTGFMQHNHKTPKVEDVVNRGAIVIFMLATFMACFGHSACLAIFLLTVLLLI